jgi:hypothetical protein
MQTLGSAECGVAKVKGSDVARTIFGGTAKGALRRFPLAEIRGEPKLLAVRMQSSDNGTI